MAVSGDETQSDGKAGDASHNHPQYQSAEDNSQISQSKHILQSKHNLL